MTIQQMKCFTAVAKNLNFRRAALQLNISQPAVTHQIQTLEKELGVQLFVRIRKQIALTENGKSLYDDTVDILDRMDMVVQKIRHGIYARESLHIGYEGPVLVQNLSKIYRMFRQHSPEVSIATIQVAPEERSAMMISRLVDAAFLSPEGIRGTSGISYKTLYHGTFCCVVPEGHRLCGCSAITGEQLHEETIILIDTAHCPPEMNDVQTELRRSSRNNVYYFSSEPSATIPMIEAGLGIAVMPDFVCPPSSGIYRIPYITEKKIEYGIAWYTQSQSAAVKDFIKIVAAAYQC